MKILHLSTCDTLGGAARAAFRLNDGLRAAGLDSRMLVQIKDSTRDDVFGPVTPGQIFSAKVRQRLDRLPLEFYRHRTGPFTPNILPEQIAAKVAALQPDIVHLHWIGRGFVNPGTLKTLGRPIVWTLHDQWAFTGGCHFSAECARYERECGECPVLGSDRKNDLSRLLWNRKQRAFAGLDLNVVAVGHWLGDCARKSSLLKGFPISVISNGLDIGHFKPARKAEVRERLGLPLEKKLILFGAFDAIGDRRKGFDLLIPAIQKLAMTHADVEVVVFGADQPASAPDFGVKATYLGRIEDENALVDLYGAANVMVVPSLQESFGQTASEAMACGTPVVAFGATGLLDVVEHLKTGYLAKPFEADDLAAGIAWVLADPVRWQALSAAARDRVQQRFALPAIAGQYVELYRRILIQTR